MGKLARLAEIGICVQAPGASARVWGYRPQKNFEIEYAKSRNPVHFSPENSLQYRP